MSDAKKTIKFQMLMTPAEAEAIDDWGFKHRIRSRAEAIRRLCQIALFSSSQTRSTLSQVLASTKRFREEIVSPKNSNGDNNKSIQLNARIIVLEELHKILLDASKSVVITTSLMLGDDVDEAISLGKEIQEKLESMDPSSKEYSDTILNLLRAFPVKKDAAEDEA